MVRGFPVRPQFMVGRFCNNCVYNQTSLSLTTHLPTKRIVVQVELSSLEEILLERAVSDHERKCWSGEGGGGGREKTSVEQTVTVTGRAQSDCGTRATQVQTNIQITRQETGPVLLRHDMAGLVRP